MCSVVIFYIVLFRAVYVVVVVNVAVVLTVDRWNESLVPKEYTVKVLIAYIEWCGVDQSFLADHLFVQSQQYFYAIKVVKKSYAIVVQTCMWWMKLRQLYFCILICSNRKRTISMNFQRRNIWREWLLLSEYKPYISLIAIVLDKK